MSHVAHRAAAVMRAARRRLLDRPSAQYEPLLPLRVLGPPWFTDLFTGTAPRLANDRSGEVTLVGPGVTRGEIDSTVSGRSIVGFRNVECSRNVDSRPFIDVLRSNPLDRIVPDGLPLEFSSLSEAGCGGKWPAADVHSPLSELRSWVQATSISHLAYREAHSRSARDVGLEALSIGSRHVAKNSIVTVICVSNRPDQLDNIVANYERQTTPDKELLVVTNSDLFDQRLVARTIDSIPGARALSLPEQYSLGNCLNQALAVCSTRFVAKFDDDDWYGPNYLHDMLLTHNFAGAAVVGKHSHFAFMAGDQSTWLRFPGREFLRTGYLAGGTLVIDTARTGAIRFPDRSVGEDSGFLDAVNRSGQLIVASDKFNYLQFRHEGNTWRVSRRDYTKKALRISGGLSAQTVEV